MDELVIGLIVSVGGSVDVDSGVGVVVPFVDSDEVV